MDAACASPFYAIHQGVPLRFFPGINYWPETPRLIGEMNGVLQLPPTKNSDWFGGCGACTAA